MITILTVSTTTCALKRFNFFLHWDAFEITNLELYKTFSKVNDYDLYMTLRNRPDNWSEKKAYLGVSNLEPPGSSRKRRQQEEGPIFDPVAWGDWRPVSKEEAATDVEESMKRGVEAVFDMVDNFKGKRGDAEHEEVLFYGNTYRQLLGMLSEDLEVEGMVGQLNAGMEGFQETLDVEERQLKAIVRLMAELEEEIKRYYSDRTTNKYRYIQERMVSLAENISIFKPGKQELEMVKTQYNNKLTDMWKDFESRSDTLVESLQQQMGGQAGGEMGESGLSGRLEEGSNGAVNQSGGKKAAVDEYRIELTLFVRAQLEVLLLFL